MILDDFLNSVCTTDFLKLVREECVNEESNKRKSSKSLLKMIKSVHPIDKPTDTACLQHFISCNVKDFGRFDDPDFTRRLKQLRMLIGFMYPNEKSLQVMLSAYTSIFKKYHIPISNLENDYGGPHISLVRSILKVENPQPSIQMTSNLKDKFCENMDEKKIISMYHNGMLHETKNDFSQLLISLICMTGCRKSEIWRSDVKFFQKPSKHIGIDFETNQNRIFIGNAVDQNYLISQEGRCKDKSLRINKYLTN